MGLDYEERLQRLEDTEYLSFRSQPGQVDLMFTVKAVEVLGPQNVRPGPKTHAYEWTLPDGTVMNTTSFVNQIIRDAPAGNLELLTPLWLFDLANEDSAKARRKVRILLERLIGARGLELQAATVEQITGAVASAKKREGEPRN
jgi:hypothetical protein